MLLHEKQQKVVRSKARFKVTRAGRRSGKTVEKTETIAFKAISRMIRLAREIKNRSVIFIAPTRIQARTIIWESFKSRLNGVGEFNESRLEIKVPTEDGGISTIFIGGWENRENYRGMPNVVHIEFDELDTMKDFFIGWEEIFRPMLIDTGGTAGFGGTPKKGNPNLRRLEKEAKDNPEWECFHFTSWDNPHIPRIELEDAKRDMDPNTYRQEILAEHIDNEGSLFNYDALVDVFTNTVVKESKDKYLIVDVADDGGDKTIFSFWDDMEEYHRDEYAHFSSEMIIQKIREECMLEKIPMSHVAVDAIGVGSSVASSSLLDGIVGYKSSFAPIKTDKNIVLLPNVKYRKDAPLTSDYKNLRSQCIFTLSEKVNNHAIASRCVANQKEAIIEQLSQYQEISSEDGKRVATHKEDVAIAIGHSPDDSDTWIMRMYFVIRKTLSPYSSEETTRMVQLQQSQFARTKHNQSKNSTQ